MLTIHPLTVSVIQVYPLNPRVTVRRPTVVLTVPHMLTVLTVINQVLAMLTVPLLTVNRL